MPSVISQRPDASRCDATAAGRFLRVLAEPSLGCVELRVLRGTCDRRGIIRRADASLGEYGSTFAGWFERVDALVEQAGRLRDISAYVTINPVSHDLLARSDHVLSRVRSTTRDGEIARIRWLYVDIDPVRPADISSTDAELWAAVDRRDAILDAHPPLARSAMWGRSGNGCWILVRLPDYPNDQAHRELVASCVAELAAKHGDSTVNIDTATVNPARLIGLPGTLKAKGANRPERPWRRVTLDGIGRRLANASF